MKKKDSPSVIYLSNHPYVCVTILICLVILLFWMVFGYKDSFNPDKDICTIGEKTNDNGYWAWDVIDNLGGKDKFIINYNKKYPTQLARCSFDEQGAHCYWCIDYKWRPKTKCELNPSAEGCICDEYEPCITLEKQFNKMFCLTHNNSERVRYVSMDYRNCIKSHEPNECEKDNPSYVLDLNMPCVCRDDSSTGDRVQVGSNETQLCTKVDCSMNCRKKTIQDFSCAELKKAVILNKRFVVCDTAVYKVYFTSEKFITNCWTTWISTEEIYDVAINKGCDV